MTRRLNFWLLSIILILGIPYYWFLVSAGVAPGTDDPSAKPITVAHLRALASSIEGQRPHALRVETVGLRYNSRNMMVAGGGLRTVPNMMRAYELEVDDDGPIVIDAGISAHSAERQHLAVYGAEAQARVDRALAHASHAVLLADRPTHNGGHPAGSRRSGELPSADGAPYALAPGVVVLPANGIGPGSNLVYARLADGREYLFTGDAAKLEANWRDMRPPARFATRGEPEGFRREILSWLMTINALHREAPQMMIVTGHEPAQIPFSAGTFSD